MKKNLSELELKIDYMNARLLNTPPEKQEKAKEQLQEYHKVTGRNYIPDIQRRKYEEGEY